MTTSIISVANVAAGAGKTTLAVSLAKELSLRGHQTLLIDADPQATATDYFIKPERVKLSLADVMCTTSNAKYGEPMQASVTSLSKVVLSTRFDNLDLAPSTIRLAAVESNPFAKDSLAVLDKLKSQIGQLETDYEFVIIDTPPFLGQTTNACLRASTHVVVPVAPHKSSIDGLRLIVERLGDMPCYSEQANVGDMPCVNERIELLGVVFNHFDCQRPMSGTIFTNLRREWKDLCFDTVIHRDALIESCTERYEVLQAEHPRSPAATLYAELTDEIVRRIAVPLDVPLMRDCLATR